MNCSEGCWPSSCWPPNPWQFLTSAEVGPVFLSFSARDWQRLKIKICLKSLGAPQAYSQVWLLFLVRKFGVAPRDILGSYGLEKNEKMRKVYSYWVAQGDRHGHIKPLRPTSLEQPTSIFDHSTWIASFRSGRMFRLTCRLRGSVAELDMFWLQSPSYAWIVTRGFTCYKWYIHSSLIQCFSCFCCISPNVIMCISSHGVAPAVPPEHSLRPPWQPWKRVCWPGDTTSDVLRKERFWWNKKAEKKSENNQRDWWWNLSLGLRGAHGHLHCLLFLYVNIVQEHGTQGLIECPPNVVGQIPVLSKSDMATHPTHWTKWICRLHLSGSAWRKAKHATSRELAMETWNSNVAPARLYPPKRQIIQPWCGTCFELFQEESMFIIFYYICIDKNTYHIIVSLSLLYLRILSGRYRMAKKSDFSLYIIYTTSLTQKIGNLTGKCWTAKASHLKFQ